MNQSRATRIASVIGIVFPLALLMYVVWNVYEAIRNARRVARERSEKPQQGEAMNEDNLRLGYQTSVSLWMNELQLGWNRFNAMLTANSLIVAASALTFVSGRHPHYTRLTLGIVGLVLCVFWFLVAQRGKDYSAFWMAWAREVEDKLPDVNIVNSGHDFAERGHATVGGVTYKTPRTKTWLVRYLAIGLFALVYLFLAVTSILQK